MKKIIILLLICLSPNLFAAIPTVEGLLRHGSNEDIESDTIVLRLKLEKKIESPLDFTAIKDDLTTTVLTGEAGNTDKPIYMKLVFSKVENRPLSLLQVLYSSKAMDEDTIIAVKLMSDVGKDIRRDTNIERQLFYSLIFMFSTNKSVYFSDLLKKLNVDFRSNLEMLDPEKKTVFRKYKDYLTTIKQDSSLKDSLESPLNLSDKDENEKVKDITKRNMYVSNESVKLIRDNGKFYWRVLLENFDGLFSNIKNQLLKFELNTPNGIIKSTVTDYVLFDGSHELPKNIIIKDIIDSIYHLQVLGYSTFNSPSKTIKTRYLDYLKRLEKSSAKNQPYSKDYFIY